MALCAALDDVDPLKVLFLLFFSFFFLFWIGKHLQKDPRHNPIMIKNTKAIGY